VRKGRAVLAAAGHVVETRRIADGTKALCLQDVKAATATDAVEATSAPQTPSRLAQIEHALPSGGVEVVPASPGRRLCDWSREGTSSV
jgi:hypothetical protein